MSPRTRATFAKRQKEQARQEKQRAKAQRKLERKLGTAAPAESDNIEQASPNEEAPEQASHISDESASTEFGRQ